MFKNKQTASSTAFQQLWDAANELKNTKKAQIKDIDVNEGKCQTDLAKDISEALQTAEKMDQNGDQIHQKYEQFNQNLADLRANQDTIREKTKDIRDTQQEKADVQANHMKDQAFEKTERDTMQEVLTQLQQAPDDAKAAGNQKARGNLKVVVTLVKSMMSESTQKTARSTNQMTKDNEYYTDLLKDLRAELTHAEGVVKALNTNNGDLLKDAQGLAGTGGEETGNKQLRLNLYGTKTGDKYTNGEVPDYQAKWKACQRYKNAASITKILNHEINGLDQAMSALKEIMNNPDAGMNAGDTGVPGQVTYP